MSMDNLRSIQNELAQNQLEKLEIFSISEEEREQADVLTEEEEATIQKLQEENAQYVVVEKDEQGRETTVPVDEYLAPLDARITQLKEDETIKTLQSGKMQEDLTKMKDEAKQRALDTFRALSGNEELTDEQCMEINNLALQAVTEYLKIDIRASDEAMEKLNKMSLREIISILPPPFVDVYLDKSERLANNVKSKEKLLAAISYLFVTGPDMDNLNEYLETENKLITVSNRLLQAQTDFAEMIKDETKISELAKRALDYEPADDSFWAKYIKLPNYVRNEFAQKRVICEEYVKAYETIMEDYPDTEDNQRARAIIQTEIDESLAKAEIYGNVCELVEFKEVWANMIEGFKVNKKLSLKYLNKQMETAIQRVRRCKINLPFPGFTGKEKKNEEIMKNNILGFIHMVVKYNEELEKAIKLGEEQGDTNSHRDVSPIDPKPYDLQSFATAYSVLLTIAFSRILKKMDVDNTKDALLVDAYFQLYCHMGQDIYIMSEMDTICHDGVIMILERMEK